MSISFRAIPRTQPGVEGGGEIKYYAYIVRGKKVDLRTFVEEIAELNTVNTADVFAVLESFLQLSVRHLSQGRPIDMGQLGSFSPSLRSKSEDSAKEVTSNTIGHLKINFRLSRLLNDRLSRVRYEKVGGTEEEEVAP